MKIITGLGNPGEKYKNTRHNVGFMFLDFFAEKHSFEDFHYESKCRGEISSGKINAEKVILLKPQTFMNLSGESLRKICDFYKLDSSDFLVVYDDMSLDFGKVRFRDKGSAGGHNGVKDIIRHFDTIFDRVKIGIGLDKRYNVSNWVLSKFKEEELIDLDNDIFKKTEEIVLDKI